MRLDDPGPYAIDTLAAMTPPQLFSTDAQALKARYVGWFEEATGRTLYPMQVEMLLIEALAFAVSIIGEEAQAALEAQLVAFSTGANLDALGPNRSTARLPAAKALTTLRFSIEAIRAANVNIPAGTICAAGNAGRFATIAVGVIRAGTLTADVPAEAVEVGEAANGYGIDQITTIEAPIEGVSVSNITVSAGGADVESDELYRLRLANAFDRVSSGGGYGWYRETAMGVSAALIDCGVVRPEPCYVDLYPLTSTGAAGVDLRNQVLAAFNTVRALENRFGDLVTVKVATAVTKSPVITVHARQVGASLQADATAAAMALLTEWSQRLGATLAPHDVEARVRVLPGVIDVATAGLDFEQLAESEFLVITSLTVNIVWVA